MAVSDLIEQFNAAWLRGDLPAVLACVSDDIVYSTSGRDGVAQTRRGRSAMAEVFASQVGDDPDLQLGPIAAGAEHAVCHWSYPPRPDGTTLRGVDVYVIVNGRIAAKDVFAKTA